MIAMPLNMLEIIARLGVIARLGIITSLSYNTSFGLYEKVDVFTFLSFSPLHKMSHAVVSCTYFRSQSKVIFIKTSVKSDPPLW